MGVQAQPNHTSTSGFTYMRAQAGRLRQWLRTGLLPRFSPGKQVQYLGWDAPTESLDETVNKHLDHPAKALALDWLEREPLLPEKFTLLDVGCGPGVLPAMIEQHSTLKNRVSYTGIDQSEPALERCRAVYQGDFQFLKINLQTEEIPERCDVVMISEVIEHLPHYREVVESALALKPRILVLTTFGVIPGLRRDRLRWNEKHKAYMNSYSFARLYEYLRSKTDQLWVADFGTQDFTRYWFTRKALLVFYLRLAEKRTLWTQQGWVTQ